MKLLSMSCVLSACIVSWAGAELIEVDNEFGQGAGTVDTENLLEFLDLTETVGISFVDMVDVHLADGGMYSGWRIAYRAEVWDFVSSSWDFGGDPGGVHDSGMLWPSMNFVGVTSEYLSVYHESIGFVMDDFHANEDHANVVLLREVDNKDFSYATGYGSPDYLASETIGFWLVRDTTIPAPSGFCALGIGIGFMSYRRRR